VTLNTLSLEPLSAAIFGRPYEVSDEHGGTDTFSFTLTVNGA